MTPDRLMLFFGPNARRMGSQYFGDPAGCILGRYRLASEVRIWLKIKVLQNVLFMCVSRQ